MKIVVVSYFATGLRRFYMKRMHSRGSVVEDKSFGAFFRGFKDLWELIGEEQNEFTRIIFIVAGAVLIQLLSPFTFKLVIDEIPGLIQRLGNGGEIGTYFIQLFVAMFTVKIFYIYIKHFSQDLRFYKSIIPLKNRWPVQAYDKLLELSLTYHQGENTGAKIAKISNGCQRLTEIMEALYVRLLPQVLFLIINLLFIFWIDWRLAVVFALPFIPVIWISIKSQKKIKPYWEEIQIKTERSSDFFCQAIINIETVQVYNQETREVKNFSELHYSISELEYTARKKMQEYGFWMNFIFTTCLCVVILLEVIFIIQGTGTIGNLAYIIATSNTTFQYLIHLTYFYIEVLRKFIVVRRLKDLLDEKVEVKNYPGAVSVNGFREELRFNLVDFAYAGNDHLVLKDFNFSILPGQTVALIGKSGEGKTTFLKLLSRMADVSGGSITLDDVDIRRLEKSSYRRLFAVVHQDIGIFENTLLNNICYAHPGATDSEIEFAIKAAGLDLMISDIERFPNGLNTNIKERGVSLSGGERQRVAIARAYLALAAGAKVLLLDEATSHLDSETEKAVQRMLDELRRRSDVAIVIVAHRLSTVKDADKICVLNSGEIVEQGKHWELLSRNGLYAQAVRLQNLDKL